MSWVCFNGHTNDDDRSYCLTCNASRPTPINPLALFVIVMGVFAGPAYPVSGGLAWAAMGAIALAGATFFHLPLTGLLIPGAIAAVVVFWNAQSWEHAASEHRAYRLLRDAIRLAIGGAIVWWAYSDNGPKLPPGELFGIAVLVPVGYFVLKRLDTVMDVGPPPGQSVRRIPGWLEEFIRSSNWANAAALGFFAAVLGFMLGRDARILTALVLWVLVAFIVMAFSGGMGVLMKQRGPASAFGRLALGVPLGGWLGWFFIHGIAGLVIGAVAGPMVLFVIRRKRS
jgi:MFS family permease